MKRYQYSKGVLTYCLPPPKPVKPIGEVDDHRRREVAERRLSGFLQRKSIMRFGLTNLLDDGFIGQSWLPTQPLGLMIDARPLKESKDLPFRFSSDIV